MANTKKRYFEDIESDPDFIPLADPLVQTDQIQAKREEEAIFNRMLVNGLQRIESLEAQLQDAMFREKKLAARNYALRVDNHRLERNLRIEQEKVRVLAVQKGPTKPSVDVSERPKIIWSYPCRQCREVPAEIFVCCSKKCHNEQVCARDGCDNWPRGSGARRCNEYSPEARSLNKYSRFCSLHASQEPTYVDRKVLFVWDGERWKRVR